MPSSVAKHTIPSFYACYFLRSLSSPGITYIGSTPAPPRRKRQHNGDLTQGAYKTARARPWEMECIVYGFSSKIAALQFEWAWAKPHLSRHLKFLATEYGANGTPSDSSSAVGKPLFPSTSMTPGQTRWGRPKKRMARAPSTPNARLLAMRALLRSEPFSGWGLKLAFFTEWSWLAYQRVEGSHSNEVILAESAGLRTAVYSRSGKLLHPSYPLVVCDFTGVDGKRIPLIHVSAQHRTDAGVAGAPVKKRQSSSKKKVDTEDDALPQWSEVLPRSANMKGLDACIQDFATFPSPSLALPNTDLTKKAKRVTKADKAAAVSEQEADEEAEDEDADAEPEAVEATSPLGASGALAVNRMRFDDLNVEQSGWERFERVISSLNPSSTQAMSEFMQICVQRHIAFRDARTLQDAPVAPTAPCALCDKPIDLTRQLDFVMCPNPHPATLPSNEGTTVRMENDPCQSVFHLSCLAESFLKQQGSGGVDEGTCGAINTVLPTHGVCPCHRSPSQVATWADVVRGMYRRYERFERLLEFLARSGRTLAEHLSPPEAMMGTDDVVTKKSKAKARTKATAKDAAIDGAAEEAPKSPRKRRKPVASTSEEALTSTENGQAAEAEEVPEEKITKRKVSRQAKVAIDTTDVIDLT